MLLITCFFLAEKTVKNGVGIVALEEKSADDLSDTRKNVRDASNLRQPSFNVNQLVSVVRDLFLAGVDTTATTLTWLVLYLSKHPEIQKKMRDEIDDVLGLSGVPKMATLEKMTYVRAVIQVFILHFHLNVIMIVLNLHLVSSINLH